MSEEINIQLINESVSSFMSGLKVNHPDFSINELKETLTEMIGQKPAITVKRKPVPINELVNKAGGKPIQQKDRIEEISIFYVDMENKKPVKITMLF